MGRWVLGFVGGASVALALLQASACSISADGTATMVDATADVGPLDAHLGDASDGNVGDAQPDVALDAGVDASDGGGDATDCLAMGLFFCGTQCVSSCAGCSAGTAECLATRVCGDCTACAGATFACYNCPGGPPVGFCSATKCGGGGTDCPCPTDDAGACPGKTQICTGGGNPVCKTCGSGGTDNKQCANGKQCTESTGLCLP